MNIYVIIKKIFIKNNTKLLNNQIEYLRVINIILELLSKIEQQKYTMEKKSKSKEKQIDKKEVFILKF